MGTAAVANQALSCHHYGSSMHGSSGAESPSPSTSQRAVFQRTGLSTLPCQEITASRHRNHRRRDVLRPAAGHALLETTTNLDTEGIVAEAPALLALSSDFDWQQSVTELRDEARGVLSAQGEREMASERLGGEMRSRLHDSMFATILQPSLLQGAQYSQEEFGVLIRVEELRWQAALQAAEELASGVDSSFDWENEAAELRQCIVNQDGVDSEQKLLKSWESSRENMDKDAQLLHDEALKVHHSHANSGNKAFEKSSIWKILGVAMEGWFVSEAMNAIVIKELALSNVIEVFTNTTLE